MSIKFTSFSLLLKSRFPTLDNFFVTRLFISNLFFKSLLLFNFVDMRWMDRGREQRIKFFSVLLVVALRPLNKIHL